MATQVENGKAFEWAMATALSDSLNLEIVENDAATTALRCSALVSGELRNRFSLAAEMATQHFLAKESSNPLVMGATAVRLASDSAGQKGDVRDVLLVGKGNASIGISCKTNHDAFKHPRLSGTIDFVKKWGLDAAGCSEQYWSTVRPVFNELKSIRLTSNKTALWADLVNMHDRFYVPVLEAFQEELWRVVGPANQNSKMSTRGLVDFIIGRQDFYKVISNRAELVVEAFNLNGTLSTSMTKYPDCAIAIDDLDGGEFSKTVRLQKGMTFDFRLHSASSRVEPSMKFDVRAVGLPADVYQHHQDLFVENA